MGACTAQARPTQSAKKGDVSAPRDGFRRTTPSTLTPLPLVTTTMTFTLSRGTLLAVFALAHAARADCYYDSYGYRYVSNCAVYVASACDNTPSQ